MRLYLHQVSKCSKWCKVVCNLAQNENERVNYADKVRELSVKSLTLGVKKQTYGAEDNVPRRRGGKQEACRAKHWRVWRRRVILRGWWGIKQWG